MDWKAIIIFLLAMFVMMAITSALLWPVVSIVFRFAKIATASEKNNSPDTKVGSSDFAEVLFTSGVVCYVILYLIGYKDPLSATVPAAGLLLGISTLHMSYRINRRLETSFPLAFLVSMIIYLIGITIFFGLIYLVKFFNLLTVIK